LMTNPTFFFGRLDALWRCTAVVVLINVKPKMGNGLPPPDAPA
jgi:hypothetical protein